MNILEKIKLGRLVLKLYNQVKEPKKMWDRLKRDPKTTVSGIVAILAQIAKAAGVDLPPELFNGITMVAAALFAFFTRDSHAPGEAPK